MIKINNLDKKLFKALDFLATVTRERINFINKEGDKRFYSGHVPEEVENALIQWKYIDLHGNSKHIITKNGLEQLRQLEKIKNKDLTLTTAVIALIISIYNFLKSFGLVQF
ncbi:MAG TPA: hypothetical protein VJJ52_04125 [Candidatus Nanoarchaeia archaeon]|nr:hypothetical protein [Candidatus Nanoarchaeia archaeon]